MIHEVEANFKTRPFPHQLEEWNRSRDAHSRAIFWEQGTGKTWLAINTAAHLFREGKIDAVVVVAPNGVHRNWVTEEIPRHLPEDVMRRTRSLVYRTDKATTRWHQEECEAALAHQGLSWVAMSFDAVVTDPIMDRDKDTGSRRTIWRGGKKFLWDLLSTRRVLYIVDESRRIKNPKADRTKVVVKSGRHAPYRRILNGTPVPNGPFDLFPQLQFLDERFWEQHGLGSWAAFRAYFGKFKRAQVRNKNGKLVEFDQLVDYQNLDILNRIVDTIGTRVLKEDVLDLPPKVYTRREFDLTDSQLKVYRSIRDDFMAMLSDGKMVSAPLAITRLLRLQQVASGFVASDDGEPAVDLGKVNPRLDLVLEIAEDLPHKAIIWTKFRRTVDKIMDALGSRAVRYDGVVDEDARGRAVSAFNSGDVQFFVANQQTACEGLTLLGDQAREAMSCKTAIVAEHTFDLAVRLQLEDRNHRIGQNFSTEYIDVCGAGTIDRHIVSALREKFDVAQQITGDRVKEWLA